MTKAKKSTSIVLKPDTSSISFLPKKLKERLTEKMIDRNEEVILDYMDQIKVHKREILRLQNLIKNLIGDHYGENV